MFSMGFVCNAHLQEKKIFQIPWMHAARHGWDVEKDAPLFRNWAIHTGMRASIHTWNLRLFSKKHYHYLTLPEIKYPRIVSKIWTLIAILPFLEMRTYCLSTFHFCSGKYQPGVDKPDPKTWKANFRCAMNSLPDIEEVKDKSIKKGTNAFRVYKMLSASERQSKRGQYPSQTPMPVHIHRAYSANGLSAPCRTKGHCISFRVLTL